MGTDQGIAGMIARGVVALANAGRKLQALQVRITASEVKDAVEHFEPYGFTSHPLPGAEAVVVFPGGDRSHSIALMVADRRYRLQGLESGEVALFTDEGDSLVFKRGRIVELTTDTLRINAATKVEFNTPLVEALHQMRVVEQLTGNGGAAFGGGAGGVALTVAGTAAVSNDLIAGGKSSAHHRHAETGNITNEPQ